jgi:hypothetical protein
MPDAVAHAALPPVLADASEGEAFAAIADPDVEASPGRKVLHAIATKIGRTRLPSAESDIPAGATYLAQFAVHDLDLRSREDVTGRPLLDLALIYGDGPKHDTFLYQVPDAAGEPRCLLRMGRARPSANSPAWGAARDLPRTSCPHLDAHGVDVRSEVMIPNAFSDSNLMLGQVQTLWALLHNAVAGRILERRHDPRDAFETARRITRHVYRSAILNDVLGAFVLEGLRGRYAADRPETLQTLPPAQMPRVFMTGVARIGHCLVREIYALNDRRQVEGLRGLIRHNSTSRPTDMPLTEDWLLDFGLFHDLGGAKAQRARAIGPHVARPFGLGGGVGLDAPHPGDGLVLRDLVACTRSGVAPLGGIPSVRALVARIEAAAPGLIEGCLAQDERRRTARMADWLADVEMDPGLRQRLAADPPLTLFLMIEAEADAKGRSLGALGSILFAETLIGALPEPAPEADLAMAQEIVFQGPVPRRMADLVRFLQRCHQFPDGARLHAPETPRPAPARPQTKPNPSEIPMLDNSSSPAGAAAGLFEVADYIELGRLVADWTRNPQTRPGCIADLVAQLDGIARVPDNFKDVKFVDGAVDTLVIRLPEKGVMQETMTSLESPLVGDRYPLPKFYDDIYHRHFGPEMTSLDTFLARMGDYTIAQCR